MTSGGTNLNSRGIKYPCSYNTTSATLDGTNDNAVQTFNGSGLTATLVLVTASNVGIQFVITNTSGGNMSVTTSGAQLIYSSSGAASAATRTLATGHSHIFTAIQTTGASTYGWSMV